MPTDYGESADLSGSPQVAADQMPNASLLIRDSISNRQHIVAFGFTAIIIYAIG
jgi:hypothetical protein